jgi:hypothetical protein
MERLSSNLLLDVSYTLKVVLHAREIRKYIYIYIYIYKYIYIYIKLVPCFLLTKDGFKRMVCLYEKAMHMM